MLVKVSWLGLALVHLAPSIAFVIPSLITRLYSIAPEDPNFLLLHHRSALFCAVFVGCLWAVVDPAVRRLVVVATAISMISFLGLYWMHGQPKALRPIAIADMIGLPLLLYAGLHAYSRIGRSTADHVSI